MPLSQGGFNQATASAADALPSTSAAVPRRARTTGRGRISAAHRQNSQASLRDAVPATSVWTTVAQSSEATMLPGALHQAAKCLSTRPSRSLDKVCNPTVTKAKRPSHLRQSSNLQAEETPMPGSLSEEVVGYIDDPMDEDFVLGSAAGSGLPSRASSRQAGKKRARQGAASSDEEEHLARSTKRAKAGSQTDAASSDASNQSAVLAPTTPPKAHNVASPFRYADGRATTHKAEAAAGSSDAAPALPMDNSRASAPGVISSDGPPAAPSYKEGSCAFSHTIYQGAQAQGILGTGRPSPGTPTPVRSSTQIVAQSWLAAAVTAAFSNLAESEAEEVYFCGDSWDSLLSEDLGAAAPAASSPELPQPAFLPRPLGVPEIKAEAAHASKGMPQSLLVKDEHPAAPAMSRPGPAQAAHLPLCIEGPPTPAQGPSAAPVAQSSLMAHIAAPARGSYQREFAAFIHICPTPDLQTLAARWLAEPALRVVPPLTEFDLLY